MMFACEDGQVCMKRRGAEAGIVAGDGLVGLDSQKEDLQQ